MNHLLRLLLFLVLLGAPCVLLGQDTLRVLFIGNSYTGTNNLPEMIKQVAASAGHHLDYTAHMPGGTTFQDHYGNTTVQGYLNSGGWDAIVFQEQSQVPTIPYWRNNITFLYAPFLENLARNGSPCARLVLYQTWGRRYGGQQCAGAFCSAPFANFGEMQDTLTWAYAYAADSMGAEVTPVGEAWRASLALDSTIVLHSGDNSHPSVAGTYLAACTFYASLFRKSALEITTDQGLSAPTAAHLRTVADSIFWNYLPDWRVDTTSLAASLTATADSHLVLLQVATNGTHVTWPVGATVTSDTTATWLAVSTGEYTFSVWVHRGCDSVLVTDTAWVQLADTADTTAASIEIVLPVLSVYPNPVATGGQVQVAAAGPVQWVEVTDLRGCRRRLPYTPEGGLLVEVPAGVYMLYVQVAQGEPLRSLLVVQ